MCQCCTPKVKALSLFLSGAALVVLAIVLPSVIKNLVSEKICDQLCVPGPNDPTWKIDNWKSNYNDSLHPPEYISFYVYNLTNPANVILKSATPVVTQLGPYTYRLFRDKYNVSYVGNEKVNFESITKMVFEPSLSAPGLSESDSVYSVNQPFTAGAQMFYWAGGIPYYKSALGTACSTPPHIGPASSMLCLIAPATIRELLFYQDNAVVRLANFAIYNFAENRMDPTFRLYFNCSTPDECHTLNSAQHWFGFGGVCKKETFSPNFPYNPYQCQAPAASSNYDITWTTYTGKSDISKLGLVDRYLGNSSVSVYAQTEKVSGHDKYNFQPFITSDDTLSVWEELLLRKIDLKYSRDSSVLGIDSLRFTLTDDLFSGTDPRYNYLGKPIPKGLFNASNVPLFRYGEPSSVFASAPHFYGADASIKNGVICTNCPTDLDPETHVSFVDVEPITGSVLNGALYGQVNAYIGSTEVYGNNCSLYDPNTLYYVCVKPTYLPVFWYKYYATLTQKIADTSLSPGLNQAVIAMKASKGLLYGGSILGGILLLASALILYFHIFKAPSQEPINERMSMSPDVNSQSKYTLLSNSAR